MSSKKKLKSHGCKSHGLETRGFQVPSVEATQEKDRGQRSPIKINRWSVPSQAIHYFRHGDVFGSAHTE